ncbi:MAG TPA: amidase [Steroidobacteraceae bacterium]|nr:amidase [Steroidobacteraceae bacterium]
MPTAAAPSLPSLAVLQQELAAGRRSAESVVRACLARIAALERAGPQLHALISINPDALKMARTLDRERRDHGALGPLHGIPVLIKDNIDTADRMPTTAGSLALRENFALEDAPLVAGLRAAGAIILGKTNLSEWANFRSSHSISGWSALGGLTRNPHVLDRSACGSSAGSAVAVAAGLAPLAVGTETDGSIVCPSAMNGIVGLKPTVGLISQQGIIPISHSQDTAGPMATGVRDVAVLLSALVDPAQRCRAAGQSGPGPCPAPDYAAALDGHALAGKRIGVLRFKPASHPPQLDIVYERALARLRSAGAQLIEVPMPDTSALSEVELKVLLSEFKTDLDRYLALTPPAVRTRSLAQLISFDRDSAEELAIFGQDLLEQAQATGGIADPAYAPALVTARRLAREEGLDRMLAAWHLDLLVAPTTVPAWRVDSVNGDPSADSSTTLPAVAGYPHLTVPMGEVRGLPVGLSFIGPAWSEAMLLGCGFAFESAGQPLAPVPRLLPTLETAALARGRP